LASSRALCRISDSAAGPGSEHGLAWRAVGLGEEFLVELWRIFGLIENAPATWPQLDEKVRRCRLDRFPFGVYYRIDPDRIVVFAVMHGRRRPGAWKKRR